MKKVLLIIVVLFGVISLGAQEKMTLRLDNIDASKYQKGDEIVIAAYCDEITDVITGWQFYFQFTEEVMTYVELTYKNPAMEGEWINSSIGYLWSANWVDPNLKGVSLNSGDKLFELTFIYNGGTTDLTWSTESENIDGKLIFGETMVVDGKYKEYELKLVNGCVCNK